MRSHLLREKLKNNEESIQKRDQEPEDFYDASDESFPDSETESENEEKPEPRLRTRDGLEIPFNWDKKTSRQKKEQTNAGGGKNL